VSSAPAPEIDDDPAIGCTMRDLLAIGDVYLPSMYKMAVRS
jgi:hypothetical protein